MSHSSKQQLEFGCRGVVPVRLPYIFSLDWGIARLLQDPILFLHRKNDDFVNDVFIISSKLLFLF